MTDDTTAPLPKPPSEDPGETLRPASPVTPSNETASLLPGAPVPSPSTDPTLIAGATRPHASQAQSRKLGPYALVRLLGRGGMGAVWEALDTRLNRRVAVKVMVAGEHASEQETERFRREAQNSAKLRHPNIVPVHDFGAEGGRHYLVMDLVDGVMLADALRQRQFTYREKAMLLEKVARAVQYAHEQGVVHRDLKPSNIMLELARGGSSSGDGKPGSSTNLGLPAEDRALGEPLVMDFGLAKDVTKDSSLSQSGQVMGTPAYMPPEQAEGRIKDVGPRSDVYSLGAILYEMLTGRVPFTGENAMQVLRAALNDEPLPPRRITPAVPRDLETICLKCLEKAPPKRYVSAQALAEDLGRWLKDEPIVARASRPWEKAAKWARRRPAAAALIVVSAVALAVLLGGGLWYNARLSSALRRATEQEQLARRSEEKARQEAAEKEKQRHEAALQLAQGLVAQGDTLASSGRVGEAHDHYAQALQKFVQLNEPTFDAEAGLCRLFADYSPPILTLLGHEGVVTSLAFSPDGQRVLSGSYDSTCKLWDVKTGMVLRTFAGPQGGVWSVAISPDGRQGLASTGDKSIKLWELETGREFQTLRWRQGWFSCVSFSPDGKRALSVNGDNTIKLWDLGTGCELRTFSEIRERVHCVAFSSDGRRALSGGMDKSLTLWDVESGKAERKITGHLHTVWGVVFSPDGSLALSASEDKTVKLWDLASGREIRTFSGNAEAVKSVAFSPDGKYVLSGGHDKSVRLWETESGRELRTFLWHRYGLHRVAYSPDGKRALSGGRDTTLMLWDLVGSHEVRTLAGHAKAVIWVAFPSSGSLALSCGVDATFKLWDVATGLEVRTFGEPAGKDYWVAFS
ncbi:MAG: protein kinase, partial [Planctomycetota bacterium]